MKRRASFLFEEAKPVDDSTGTGGGAKPAETKEPEAKPPEPKATQSKEPAEEKPGDPEWMKKRLEAHERSVLKSLGFETAEEAKKAREEQLAREDAKKTLEERIAARDTELTSAKERLSQYERAVKMQADTALSALPEDKQKIVASIAGEDPTRVLEVVAQLAPTWQLEAPKAPPSTSKAPPGPAPTTSGGPVDHKVHYETLRKTNPMAAAEYRFTHFREVTGGQ